MNSSTLRARDPGQRDDSRGTGRETERTVDRKTLEALAGPLHELARRRRRALGVVHGRGGARGGRARERWGRLGARGHGLRGEAVRADGATGDDGLRCGGDGGSGGGLGRDRGPGRSRRGGLIGWSVLLVGEYVERTHLGTRGVAPRLSTGRSGAGRVRGGSSGRDGLLAALLLLLDLLERLASRGGDLGDPRRGLALLLLTLCPRARLGKLLGGGALGGGDVLERLRARRGLLVCSGLASFDLLDLAEREGWL